jgi:hypothetical protein
MSGGWSGEGQQENKEISVMHARDLRCGAIGLQSPAAYSRPPGVSGLNRAGENLFGRRGSWRITAAFLCAHLPSFTGSEISSEIRRNICFINGKGMTYDNKFKPSPGKPMGFLSIKVIWSGRRWMFRFHRLTRRFLRLFKITTFAEKTVTAHGAHHPTSTELSQGLKTISSWIVH